MRGRGVIRGPDLASVTPLAKGRIDKQLDVGRMPKGISIGPRGTSAYVTNMGSDTMTQISLKQQHRLGVEVGSARWRGRRGCPRTPGNDAADLGG